MSDVVMKKIYLITIFFMAISVCLVNSMEEKRELLEAAKQMVQAIERELSENHKKVQALENIIAVERRQTSFRLEHLEHQVAQLQEENRRLRSLIETPQEKEKMGRWWKK
jgi:cell shape-determining protein MreC